MSRKKSKKKSRTTNPQLLRTMISEQLESTSGPGSTL